MSKRGYGGVFAGLIDTEVTVTLIRPVKDFFLKTENHGGYEGGECLCCGAQGWLDVEVGASNGIVHRKDCALVAALQGASIAVEKK